MWIIKKNILNINNYHVDMIINKVYNTKYKVNKRNKGFISYIRYILVNNITTYSL